MFHRYKILGRVRCRWGASGCDRSRASSIPHPLLAQRMGHPAYAASMWNCILIQTGSGAQLFDDSMLVIVMIVSIVIVMRVFAVCDRIIHGVVSLFRRNRWAVCMTVATGRTVIV